MQKNDLPSPAERSHIPAAADTSRIAHTKVHDMLAELSQEERQRSAPRKVEQVLAALDLADLGDTAEVQSNSASLNIAATSGPAYESQSLVYPSPKTGSSAPGAIHPTRASSAEFGRPKAWVPISEPPAIPARIGRATIETKLGQGAAGIVYRGHDELLDLPVAVKVMRQDLLNNNTAGSKRFLLEARLAVRLSHPNIVRLYDVGEWEDSYYLSYEYIDGGSLADLLKRCAGNRLTSGKAVSIALDIARALVEANKLGVIHRDIKPPNILLTSAGQAKLADLGLAKQLLALEELNITQHGNVVGTPYFMAPEQAIAGAKVDIRADMYALGVTLFQMLTGHLPFKGASLAEVFVHHQQTPPPNPCDLLPEIPSAVGAMCLRLLAKDPAQRFERPEDLVGELKGLMAMTELGDALATPSTIAAIPAMPASGLPVPASRPLPDPVLPPEPEEDEAPAPPQGFVAWWPVIVSAVLLVTAIVVAQFVLSH